VRIPEIAVELVVEVARSAHLAQDGTRDPSCARPEALRREAWARGQSALPGLASDQLHDEQRDVGRCSKPWICAMQGWFTAARSSPSRWNRASRSRSVATATARIFNDVALQSRVAGLVTFAHAPAPMRPSISYGPSRVRLKEGPLLDRRIRRGGGNEGSWRPRLRLTAESSPAPSISL
jgi:hypothetical protein